MIAAEGNQGETKFGLREFIPLPDNFLPGNKDVICGKGNAYCTHPGNSLYKTIVGCNLERYENTPKKNEKSLVISAVLGELLSQGFRFVKKDRKTKQWFELGRKKSHEKVGHTLRDMPNYKHSQFTKNASDTNSVSPLVSLMDMKNTFLGEVQSDPNGGDSTIQSTVDRTVLGIIPLSSDESPFDDWSEFSLDWTEISLESNEYPELWHED
jgi:hypothetical protein